MEIVKTITRKDDQLFYNADWDLIAITKNKGAHTFLITSELEESSNIYRVLTIKWEYIGDL